MSWWVQLFFCFIEKKLVDKFTETINSRREQGTNNVAVVLSLKNQNSFLCQHCGIRKQQKSPDILNSCSFSPVSKEESGIKFTQTDGRRVNCHRGCREGEKGREGGNGEPIW